MYINNNLARINIPHQELLDIIKKRKIMKNNYLNDYQSYMRYILNIQSYNEEKRKRWIEQEIKNRIPWYIRIISSFGCIDSQNNIKEELEEMSYSIV